MRENTFNDKQKQIVCNHIKDSHTYTKVLEEEIIDLPFAKERKIPVIRVNIHERSKSGFIVPVVSYSAAGSPLSTQERFEENIFIPDDFRQNKKIIAVKIRGNSMEDVGIEDGSIVLVKTGVYFKSGVIGIITLSDEYDWGTTCKKIMYENDHYRLISLNSKDNYEDMIVNKGHIKYIGEVIGIYEVESD